MHEQYISLARLRELSGIPSELLWLLAETNQLPLSCDKSGEVRVRLVAGLSERLQLALKQLLSASEHPGSSKRFKEEHSRIALSTLAASAISEGVEEIIEMAFQQLVQQYPAAANSEITTAAVPAEGKRSSLKKLESTKGRA